MPLMIGLFGLFCEEQSDTLGRLPSTDDFRTNAVEEAAPEAKAAESAPAPAAAAATAQPAAAPAAAAPPTSTSGALKVQLPKSSRNLTAQTKRQPQQPEGTFKLTATRPSKQRTGGKKAFRCSIL